MLLYRRLVWWYLATPVLLFLLFWFNPFIGIPLYWGLVLAVMHTSRYSDIHTYGTPLPGSGLLERIILTLCLAVLVTWGSLAVNYWDWIKHRALFYDLARCHWPVGYNYWQKPYLLSYNLMYYLPPAGFASLFGLRWLPGAVGLWTLMGYGLIFWGYFSRAKTIPELLVLFILVMTFDGWDVLACRWRDGAWPPFRAQFQNWNGTETTSNIYVFYWIPQHVIPAWLSGILLFRPELKPGDKVRFSVLLLALVAYWSPLVAIGLLVFVLIDMFSENIIKVLNDNKLIYFFSICLVIPYYLYIYRDISRIWHGLAFNNWHGFVRQYLYFISFSLDVIVAIVLLLAGLQMNRRYFFIGIFALLISPFYHLGLFNDLAIRGPMVIYYFLLSTAGDGALNLLRTCGIADEQARKRLYRLGGAAFMLMISSVSPWHDTLPVIGTILHNNYFRPIRHGLQWVDAGAPWKFQYVTLMTPRKNTIMQEADVCPVE